MDHPAGLMNSGDKKSIGTICARLFGEAVRRLP